MKIAFLIYQYSQTRNETAVLDNTSLYIPSHNPSCKTHHPQTPVCRSLPAGGVERYAANLAKALISLGHEVHVFCHKHSGSPDRKITFYHVPALGFWSPLKIWSFAISSMHILKKRRKEYDIIQGFGKTLYQDVLRMGGGCHLEFMKRTYPLMSNPFLRIFIIINPRHLFNLLLEWVIFRFGQFKRIVCNSNMCKMEFLKRYRVPPHFIDVIYNGIDLDEFSPVNKPESRARLSRQLSGSVSSAELTDSVLVLFVGSGFKRKGLRRLIESLVFLGHDCKVRLIIAGRGRFTGYRRIAEGLNVMDRIIYLGETRDVKELYDACDIFAFPTEYDAFPNVCLEAMAMGLPVIVSRTAGIAEIIDDGIGGFVLDSPVKARDLAGRIEILLDGKKREEMGKVSQKKALNYSLLANAKETLRLYKEIIHNRTTMNP